MPLAISVVIPTFKRPELLARCLHALTHQSLDDDDYEIVVVDDGHDDLTEATVNRFAIAHRGRPGIRYLRTEGTRGPAAARNRGWRAAISPVIAFTDDDTLPDRDWLRQGLAALQPTYAALSGRVVVPRPDIPTDHERATAVMETAEFVTANAFVWREALQDVGGFDERFVRPWREDSDLYFSLLRHCGPVVRANEAVVVHPVREAPWGHSLRNQANVYFDALLFKKHPKLYRERVRSRPPWGHFVIVGATLVGIVLLALGFGWAGLASLAFAAGGIGALVTARLDGTSRESRHVWEMVLTSIGIPFAAVYWRVRGAVRFRTLFP